MVKFPYFIGCFFELTKGIICLAALLIFSHFFIATLFIVDGTSMEPSFLDKQIIIVDRLTYWWRSPHRGEAVILRFPGRESDKYIKRIIGLPGDKIEIKNKAVYLNEVRLFEPYLASGIITEPDKTLIVPDGQYLVFGDNRLVSSDSRIWGSAPRNNFLGRAYFIIWPFSSAGLVPVPVY